MAILHLDDRALVRRMIAGDEAAFDEFFGHYFPGLYRFALARLAGDAQVAEEVAQGAICRAIRKLPTYRGEAALFTWLCTFCRYEISDQRRRDVRRAEAVVPIEDLPEIRAALESMVASDTPGPEAELRRKEVARWVQVTLDHLPRRYGQVLTWKYMQELSVAEIAGRLEVGPKAAESMLTRARASFRDHFASLHKAAQLGEAAP
ncbi:MAG: sigma-70 family RNA polymerase sigma factor [Acidobacteriota bacterium]